MEKVAAILVFQFENNCANLFANKSKFSLDKNKTPTAFAIGVSEFNLDDDLLSHGETPHYHRRCIVSLLSSGWDQVVPMLYGRQEIRVLTRSLERFSKSGM